MTNNNEVISLSEGFKSTNKTLSKMSPIDYRNYIDDLQTNIVGVPDFEFEIINPNNN